MKLSILITLLSLTCLSSKACDDTFLPETKAEAACSKQCSKYSPGIDGENSDWQDCLTDCLNPESN